MEEPKGSFLPTHLREPVSSHNSATLGTNGPMNPPPFQGFSYPGMKKRGHGSRSWIRIDQNGNSKILDLDKATLMRRCSLPSRDLRLLDPLFIYPYTILGREKAIVVSLEQIRCIITADEVILMNSLDSSVVQYESELCKRLEMSKDQTDDLPFEFRALELALELTCMSLDAQAKELELDVYPVLDELASSISTIKLERVRRLKGNLLALTHRVQKVRNEIEQLMDDDGDMAEMYLTMKKERMEAYSTSEHYFQNNIPAGTELLSKSVPVSPVGSVSRANKLEKALSSALSSSKYGSLIGSSNNGENIVELEMLLEAYFVVIDNTFSKLFSLKEYIDDTEDFINIKLGNVQNQLIKFELLLTAATFVTAIFAVVTGVFGMNFQPDLFNYPDAFNWVLIITGIACGIIYISFFLYFKHKRVL
ncbi:magnesium transporter MRS2-5 isoform X1 [Macadamia integrifolia]|uniref:magnesium transporter MRS2-5 isoform X1 n=1 Tax=Macadamia integrifolia TaxID=60698 RepID=UPI001C501030|nr:magnesium transporter MRS2-5 isoform X1 [Macadamia integrifolia]XP_042496448.1 magnesium transporter MRS2-5 isoform X1 [Macadamia integrifolia]